MVYLRVIESYYPPTTVMPCDEYYRSHETHKATVLSSSCFSTVSFLESFLLYFIYSALQFGTTQCINGLLCVQQSSHINIQTIVKVM